MDPTVSAVLVTGALLLALLATVWVVRDRPSGRVLTAGAAVVEVVVLVQLVVGLAALPKAHVSSALFVSYLVGSAVVLPATAAWARAEPSRWGSGVLLVGALVVAVLVARLHQIWTGHG